MFDDPLINAAHARCLDIYKTWATGLFIDGKMTKALILDQPPRSNKDELLTVCVLEIPVRALALFLMMDKTSRHILTIPQNVNGKVMTLSRNHTFSLSSLIQNGCPYDKDNRFKSTTAGIMAGYSDKDEYEDPEILLHVMHAGVVLLMMDMLRRVLAPLATTEELIWITRDMIITFDENVDPTADLTDLNDVS